MLNIIILFAALAQGPAPPAVTAAPLTLDRVVSTYVENNLELQAARFRLERTRAEEIAARLRPNPGLTVAAENLRLSGPTPSDRLNEFSAAYSETIELGGKSARRESVAAGEHLGRRGEVRGCDAAGNRRSEAALFRGRACPPQHRSRHGKPANVSAARPVESRALSGRRDS